MTVAPLILELIIVLVAAIFVLHQYGNIKKQNKLVTASALVAWYFSMIIVFVLPLDVSSTFYLQCKENAIQPRSTSPTTFLKTVTVSTTLPLNQTNNASSDSHSLISTTSTEKPPEPIMCEAPWSLVPDQTLPTLWRIVYWTSQFLTWLVLPLLQSYVCAGDFSVVGKLKRAAIENAIYYGSITLVFIVLLIYVAADPNIKIDIGGGDKLKILIISASNTWGLFLLVLLLGYGLVEVPRGMWLASNWQIRLAQTHFKLAKMSMEKQEAAEELEDVLEEVKRLSQSIPYSDNMRKFINIIISKCPDEFQEKVSRTGMDDFEEYNRDDITQTSATSEKALVTLHRKVIQTSHTVRRTNVQWDILIKRALHLETLLKNKGHIDRQWKEEFPLDDDSDVVTKTLCGNPSTKWHWNCLIKPNMQKATAILLALLSVMVVWSECTFFNKSPVLSLFAIFINLAKDNYNFVFIEITSILTILYLCFCAYFTVFRIKFFNYYYIAAHHQTDESSILFVGMLLCRLTAPLCLNFLGLIHLDTHITGSGDEMIETSYTQIMGHLDLISFISDGFNIYFPILICVLCAGTYFNLGQRCLSVFGFQRFIDGTGDMTSDMVDEGLQLVNREKRRVQRDIKARQRKQTINEFTNNSSISDRQWRGRMKREDRTKQQQNPSPETSPLMGGEEREADTSYYQKQTSSRLQSSHVFNNPGFSSVTFESRSSKDNVDLLKDAEPIHYDTIDTSQEFGISRWESNPPKNLFDDV